MQSEIIQILRKRAGLSQAEPGSHAFKTTPEIMQKAQQLDDQTLIKLILKKNCPPRSD